MLKEIRIHGRGGQGSVVTAELFAIAAFEDGKFSQAFPYLGGGGERRGAPVQAFCRISDQFVRSRCKVHNPNYVLVQDPSLFDVVDVLSGLQPDGLVIVNSDKSPEQLGWSHTIAIRCVPASKIALEVIGTPVTNSAMMGAFAGITGEIKIDSIKAALAGRFPGTVGERNAEAAEVAFETVGGVR